MDLASKLLKIRKDSGLTQGGFAAKLFVTRQAVSRWENGETTPTIDTLKQIAELFNIDTNAFFGRSDSLICQSCAMPLISIDDLGKNADKTVSAEYCAHCFGDGEFTHDRTIEEMIETNLRFLDEFNAQNGTGYTAEEARTILKMHLATLKRWQKG